MTCLSCHVESSERSHLSSCLCPCSRGDVGPSSGGEARLARMSTAMEPFRRFRAHSVNVLEILQVILGVRMAPSPRCFKSRCTTGGRVGTEEVRSSSQRTAGLRLPTPSRSPPYTSRHAHLPSAVFFRTARSPRSGVCRSCSDPIPLAAAPHRNAPAQRCLPLLSILVFILEGK